MKDQVTVSKVDQFVIDFVRNLRQVKQATQEDIGNILQLSKSFVRDVENVKSRAKYNLIHINALADNFNISPKDFLPSKPFPVDNSPKEMSKPKAPAQPSRKSIKKAAHKKTAKVAKKKA